MNAKEYYYIDNDGIVSDAVDIEELRELYLFGNISNDTSVIKIGEILWEKYSEFAIKNPVPPVRKPVSAHSKIIDAPVPDVGSNNSQYSAPQITRATNPDLQIRNVALPEKIYRSNVANIYMIFGSISLLSTIFISIVNPNNMSLEYTIIYLFAGILSSLFLIAIGEALKFLAIIANK